jgi:hypothetical protein
VPTVGDLPSTGNLPGDAHLVTATGDLYIWGTDNTWHATGHVQGPPGPAGPLDILTDVSAPPDTPAGKVLGTTATGQWGPVDPPSGGGDPRLTEVVASSYRSADLPPEWTAKTWPAGSIVTHEGRLWRAWTTAPSLHVPGEKVFQSWLPFDPASLLDLIVKIIGYEYSPPLEWTPATGPWYPGQTATYNGHLWRAATGPTSGAGHEPGTDPAWERFDLGVGRMPDPTGVPAGHVLKMTATGPQWAAP